MMIKVLLVTSVVAAVYLAYLNTITFGAIIQENDLVPIGNYKQASRWKRRQNWVKVMNNGPRFSTVGLKSHTEIECAASGSPMPNVQWLHNGKIISEVILKINTINDLQLGEVKFVLPLDCVAPHHQGKYVCVAEAGVSVQFSDPTELIIDENNTNIFSEKICVDAILSPPRIIAWSPTNMDTSGNDVLLPCVVTGKPAPAIYWLDNYGNVIKEDSDENTRYKQLDSGFLLISKVVWTDMGYYTCVAESPLGKDSAKSFVYPLKKE